MLLSFFHVVVSQSGLGGIVPAHSAECLGTEVVAKLDTFVLVAIDGRALPHAMPVIVTFVSAHNTSFVDVIARLLNPDVAPRACSDYTVK